MSMSTALARPKSRSLAYGLQMLRLFSAEHPVRSISELAELMQVSRPTAHRYASTCLELGYLEQAPMRRYRLARRSAEPGLAMLGALPLRGRALPVMQALRESTTRTVGLAVLDGDEVVYVERLRGFGQGQYEIEQRLGAGSRRPAGATPAGRALLAARDRQRALEMPRMVEEMDEMPGACGLAVVAQTDPVSALELTLPRTAIDERGVTIAILSAQLQTAALALGRR